MVKPVQHQQRIERTEANGPVIYLTNLDYKVNEQDLMQHLADFAPKRARLLTDKETGKPKGTGFVELKDTQMAQ